MTQHAVSLEPGNAVDAAIARVLDAERAADEDIAAAEREAAAIAEAARAAVRAIDARTERRIRAMRDAFARATDVALEALARHAHGRAQTDDLAPADLQRVDAAVDRLAAELTGVQA